MPGIPTYERRTDAVGQTVGVASFNSPAGQGASAIGQGLQNLGGSMGQVARQENAKLEAKQEDQGALTAANALSEGENFWNQRSTELKQGWTVGGDDIRKKSDAEFKTWKQKQLAALPTEKSRQWFDQHAERMRSRLDQDLFNHQDSATTAKVVSDTKLGMDSDYQVVGADPSRFDEITQRRIEVIKAQSRIPEGKRDEITMAYLKEAGASVEYGRMRRDPEAYLRERVAPQAARGDAVAPNTDGGDYRARLNAAREGQESGGHQVNKDGSVVTSPKGAIGIAQIMPGTGPEAAALAGLPWDEQRLSSDAAYNKALGNAYFAKQMDTFGGDVQKALAAYNMGPGSAQKGNGVAGLVAKYGDAWLAHAPAETQNYVQSITAKVGAGGAVSPSAGAGARPPAGIEFSADAPKTFSMQDVQKQYQLIDEAKRLTNQQDAQRRSEADRILGDALAMHKDGKLDPFNLAPEYFTSSYGPVEGPIKAAAYTGGRNMATDIQNFSGQSDAEITATLDASKPQPGLGYAGDDARQQVRIQAAQQVVKQRQDDPQLFAQRNKLSTSQPIDMAKPDGIAAELNKRVGTANLMNQKYGTPYRVLTNAEASQFTTALQMMPTQQKMNYLDQVRMGLAGDSRAFNSVMGQIAPDSPVTAVAGSILVKQGTVTVPGGMFGSDTVLQPRNVAALMLEGEAILNPNKADKKQDGRGGNFPMPKEIDLTTHFNDFVGTAFRGDAAGYSAAYQAYKAYYAGAASRKGILSDADNPTLAQEAALAATGGVTDYNGLGKVMKPWGLDDGSFKDRVASTFHQAIDANGLKGSAADNLSAYGLQSVGPGRYLLTNGARYLNGPNGPIEIDINHPASGRSMSGKIKVAQ